MKLEPAITASFRGHRERPQMPIDRLAAFITEGGSAPPGPERQKRPKELEQRWIRNTVDTAAAIVAAEQREIALCEQNSALVGYGYYVARRTADRTAQAVRSQDK